MAYEPQNMNGKHSQAILRDKKQARVKKWIDPKKVPQRSLTVRGLWGTSGVLILRGFWAASYFFEGVLGDLRGSGEGVGGGPLRLIFGAGLFFGA